LAVITSTQGYTGLQQALRARWLALGIRGQDLDSLAGLAERYGARLLGPWPTKHMGTDSLGRIMDVLAVKLVLVEDTQMLAEISRRLGRELTGRDVTGGQNNAGLTMQAQPKRRRRRFSAFRNNPEFARQVRSAQVLKQSGPARKRIARIAARARWGKAKVVNQGVV
jgi:hypothetical protein